MEDDGGVAPELEEEDHPRGREERQERMPLGPLVGLHHVQDDMRERLELNRAPKSTESVDGECRCTKLEVYQAFEGWSAREVYQGV